MRIAIVVGTGPAGLMAAETLARAGLRVTVIEQCQTPGRKFLMAGRGGLNLTHSESLPQFLTRYGEAKPWLQPAVEAFPPQALCSWAEGLGHKTVVGSSGRIFPESFRATELLRSWLIELGELGVSLQTGLRFTGFLPPEDDGPKLVIGCVPKDGPVKEFGADVIVLALGGASWPRTGSDGTWTPLMSKMGIGSAPLTPTNCGYRVTWTPVFREHFAGVPLKNVRCSIGATASRGDAMITSTGIEGGPIYALSDALHSLGTKPHLMLDLAPDIAHGVLKTRLENTRTNLSLPKLLERTAKLSPVAISLLREITRNNVPREPERLADLIHRAKLKLDGPEPIARAISTRGGILEDELSSDWMLAKLPGVFVAGEMLNWTAPTGGYLLQACFATGRAAAVGALRWLDKTC